MYKLELKSDSTLEQFKKVVLDKLVDGPLDTPCWLGKNKVNSSGYLYLNIKYLHGLAHVTAKKLSDTHIPDGYQCDHLCHNRWCFNPDHVEIKTQAIHLRRHADLITQCPQGHPYSKENTMNLVKRRGKYIIHNRRCKICNSAQANRSKQKKAKLATVNS